jgi:hypothetical protein
MNKLNFVMIFVVVAAIFGNAMIVSAGAGVETTNKIVLQKSTDLPGSVDSTLLYWSPAMFGTNFFVQERMPGGQWNIVNPASGVGCCKSQLHTGPYKVEYRVTIPGTGVVSNIIRSSFEKPTTINPYTITGIILNGVYTDYRFTNLPAGTQVGSTLFWVFDDGQPAVSGHTSMDARSAVQKDEKGYFARVYWPLSFGSSNPNNLGNYRIFIAYY